MVDWLPIIPLTPLAAVPRFRLVDAEFVIAPPAVEPLFMPLAEVALVMAGPVNPLAALPLFTPLAEAAFVIAPPDNPFAADPLALLAEAALLVVPFESPPPLVPGIAIPFALFVLFAARLSRALRLAAPIASPLEPVVPLAAALILPAVPLELTPAMPLFVPAVPVD
jgi:hypothetical protein